MAYRGANYSPGNYTGYGYGFSLDIKQVTLGPPTVPPPSETTLLNIFFLPGFEEEPTKLNLATPTGTPALTVESNQSACLPYFSGGCVGNLFRGAFRLHEFRWAN